MGFFSWNCKYCGESIKSPYSIDKDNAWQNDAVAIETNGSIIIGEYDGYGGIGCSYKIQDLEARMYHKRCWEKADKPTEYSPSECAKDQGFFID